MKRLGFVCALMLGLSSPALADTATIAVAGNFTQAAKGLASAFRDSTGHTVRFSFGSTGKLFAQIAKGAPFHAYLAADQARPERAIADGYAVADTRFTYAIGRLALYARGDGPALRPEILADPTYRKLALANPTTAPYGAAALSTLTALGVRSATQDRHVLGDNVAQTLQFVVSGNAEYGFVAYAQALGRESGRYWLVPEELHAPLNQDAVLLNRGADNEAARAFLAYLRSDAGTELIRSFGYGTE